MNLDENPVITANLITTLSAAVIALLVAFGIPITLEQKAAILALLGILAPVVATIWARRKTTPLVNPKDSDGTPLVRAGTGLPTRAALEREKREVYRETFRRP